MCQVKYKKINPFPTTYTVKKSEPNFLQPKSQGYVRLCDRELSCREVCIKELTGADSTYEME